MKEHQKECAAKCPEGCVSEHDDPRISEPAALRKANREQAARIEHQRNEINNRLIEIQNLQNFKRNIEQAIAECAGPDFKRRPLGGIDSLSKLVRGLRETCDRQAARIAELGAAIDHQHKEYQARTEALSVIAGREASLGLDYYAALKKTSKNEALIEDLLGALKKAVHELNTIRARDGVPWTGVPMPMKTDVTEEYFSSVVDECFVAIQHAEISKSAHAEDAR